MERGRQGLIYWACSGGLPRGTSRLVSICLSLEDLVLVSLPNGRCHCRMVGLTDHSRDSGSRYRCSSLRASHTSAFTKDQGQVAHSTRRKRERERERECQADLSHSPGHCRPRPTIPPPGTQLHQHLSTHIVPPPRILCGHLRLCVWCISL
jgi:hypothetical protein